MPNNRVLIYGFSALQRRSLLFSSAALKAALVKSKWDRVSCVTRCSVGAAASALLRPHRGHPGAGPHISFCSRIMSRQSPASGPGEACGTRALGFGEAIRP